MPKVALADTFEDWEQLCRAAAAYGDVKDLKVYLAELESALLRLKELEGLRAHLRAQRQEATQELNEVRDSGKLVAIQIRSILKGVFGQDNEMLVQFNVRPRRNRRRKSTPPPLPDLALSKS